MCGIIGYTGHRPAEPVVIEGLSKLEYRGYDSAGVAFLQNKQIQQVKASGKLEVLQEKLAATRCIQAMLGIGHTRWATHGLPTENNAHPHQDQNKKISLVHNGIIENYQSIKNDLEQEGHTFSSETDTEVLVHLIGAGVAQGKSIPEAISLCLQQVEGAYAFALISQDHPGKLWAARKSSPLLLGVGQGENFVASDIPAFLNYTRDVVYLEDGELVELSSNSWQVFDALTLEILEKKVSHIQWDVQGAQKSGFKHFMLKEIFEQPRVIQDCLLGRVDNCELEVKLPELEEMEIPKRLIIVACGTSSHAGLWANYLLESWAKIPTNVETASEFRYRDYVFQPGDMILAISQSGETADTLAGIRMAKENGVPLLGLCNVVGSSIARESDAVIYTQAGPEISVASTKAMCSQQVVLLLLAIYWGKRKNLLSKQALNSVLKGLSSLPQLLEAELPRIRERAKELCAKFSFARSFFYLGRGESFPLALEGALKLKEISYIHAEGYASGEMKHGPIALIDQEFPTFALALDDELLPKVRSNLQEVLARRGPVIALTNPGTKIEAQYLWELPKIWGPLNTFMVLPALQLFAYEMADYLGKDVDQPRNLAKSVTVE